MRLRVAYEKRFWKRGGKAYTLDYYSIPDRTHKAPPYLEMFSLIGAPALATLSTTVLDRSYIRDIPHGKRGQNPVYHETTKYGNGDYDYVTATADQGQWLWCKSERQNVPPDANGLVLLKPSAYEKYQMSCRGWRDVQPEFKNATGFSGVNMILEAREFQRLPQQILSTVRNLGKIARNVFHHESHKTLAELQLVYDYAYKPTINDVAALSVISGECARTLARFNKQGAQQNTRHYREELPTEFLFANVGATQRIYQEKRAVYVASLRCTYQQAAEDALGNLLTYHGLTLSPAQIWEAVPFSFLIDQVFLVGKALERLSRTAVTKVEYGVFMESMKVETVAVHTWLKVPSLRYFTGGCDSHGVNVDGNYPVAFTQKTTYDRYTSLPPALGGVALPQFKMPSFHNLVDDLALLRSGVGWKSDPRVLFNGPKG